MITFNRTAGTLIGQDGKVFASGIWSGHGEHANVVADEKLHGLGPLPAGLYRASKLKDGGHLGPDVIELQQVEGKSFGRTGFYIHGAAQGDVNHASSDGCIIADHPTRIKTDEELSTYRFLQVI